MPLTVDDLKFLRSGRGASLLAGELPDEPVQAVSKLRKRCSPEETSAILTMRELHRRARHSGRFPHALAERLLATDKMLQQASSWRLAVHKARRLIAAGDGPITDLCCGMGIDALAIATEGRDVTAVDRDPAAILCTEHNAEVLDVASRLVVEQADVTLTSLPAETIVHIDPDRRPRGRRGTSLADAAPPPRFLAGVMTSTAAGLIKLSAAIDPDELRSLPPCSREYVSEHGVVKQLLVGWGLPDRPAGRTFATRLTGDLLNPTATSIAAGIANPAGAGECGTFLVEPDPAVIAADATDDLAAAHDLWRIEPGHVWLTGNAPPDTPLAASFEILDQVPGREKDIARCLRKRQAGIVEVKPRGIQLDTDRLQRTLRGDGPETLSVLWTRRGRSQIAFIARRLLADPPASR